MMGRLNHDQEQFFYSFHLYEAVPDDHPVRAIVGVLDLSWVYSELSPAFGGNVLQNSVAFATRARLWIFAVSLSRTPVEGVSGSTRRHRHLTRLRRASSYDRRWGTAEELNEPPQVLRGCGEQHLVPRAAQASQSKPVKPENALHMCKSHLHLFAFAA